MPKPDLPSAVLAPVPRVLARNPARRLLMKKIKSSNIMNLVVQGLATLIVALLLKLFGQGKSEDEDEEEEE